MTCIIKGCKSTSFRNPELRFYKFPSDKKGERCRKWISAIEKGTGDKFDMTKINRRLCSKHFKNKDFIVETRLDGTRSFTRRQEAVPSVFGDVEFVSQNADADIAEKCRICLKVPGLNELTLQHTLPKSNVSIQDAISKTFNFDIKTQKLFPQKICARCFSLLIASYVLKAQMIKSDEELRQTVRTISNKPFVIQNVRSTYKEPQKTQPKPPQRAPQENVTFVISEFPDPLPTPKSSFGVKKIQPRSFSKQPQNAAPAETATSEILKPEGEIKAEDPLEMLCGEPIYAEEVLEDPLANQNEVKQEDVEMEFDGLQQQYEEVPQEENVQYFAITEIGEEYVEPPKQVQKTSRERVRKQILKPKLNLDEMLKNALEGEKDDIVYEEWPEEIQKDIERHSRKSARTCKKCGFNASRRIFLMQHLDDSKLNCSDLYEPKHKCYLCSRKFMLLRKMNDHFEHIHADFTSKDCPHCDEKDVKTAITYNYHLSTHFEPLKFICKICGMGYHNRHSYDVHLRRHDTSYLLYCDHCPYKSRDKCKIFKHLQRHLKDVSFTCEKCSKSFFNQENLRNHLFVAHQINEKTSYHCLKCDFVFMSQKDHQKHKPFCNDKDKKSDEYIRRVEYKNLSPNCVVEVL